MVKQFQIIIGDQQKQKMDPEQLRKKLRLIIPSDNERYRTTRTWTSPPKSPHPKRMKMSSIQVMDTIQESSPVSSPMIPCVPPNSPVKDGDLASKTS